MNRNWCNCTHVLRSRREKRATRLQLTFRSPLELSTPREKDRTCSQVSKRPSPRFVRSAKSIKPCCAKIMSGKGSARASGQLPRFRPAVEASGKFTNPLATKNQTDRQLIAKQ